MKPVKKTKQHFSTQNKKQRKEKPTFQAQNVANISFKCVSSIAIKFIG